MAGKRQLGTLDPVIYSKVPRLDRPPEHTLAAGLHKPNPVQGYTPEDLLAFKGSYLAYPEASEHPHSWSTTAAYLQYAGNALNQHLRTEGMLMKSMFYRPDAENLKSCIPPAEKGGSDIVRDLLLGRDKRTSLPGQHDQLRQAQSHTSAGQKPVGVHASAPSSGAAAPLAMPRPVYRNAVCCLEPGYGPRGPMSLGAQIEKVPKHPTEGGWAVSAQAPSGNSINAVDQHYAAIAAMQKKSHQLDSFLQPHPGLGIHTKDVGRIPSEYTSRPPGFEQFRAHHGPSFPDARYSAPYESPKKAQEVQHGNTVQRDWPSPRSLTTSSLNPHVPSYQERPPHPSLLSAQGQARFFHHGDPLPLRHSGSAFVPQSRNTYNGFCFPGSTEPRTLPDPRIFPASYLSQQGPRGHFLASDNYPFRPNAAALNEHPLHMSMSSANGMSSDTHPDRTLYHSSGYKPDFLPQSSSFTFGHPELSLYGTQMVDSSIHSAYPLNSTCPADTPQGIPPAKESPAVRPQGSHISAFQPVHTANSTGKVAEGLLKGDTSYRSMPRQVEPPTSNRPSHSVSEMRRPSLTSEDLKSRDVPVKETVRSEPIIIEDCSSPERSKGETRKASICSMSPKTPYILPTPPLTPSSDKEKQTSFNSVQSTSPSSPPMPVINNVFSLAPYRAYLEGTAEHPFAKRHKTAKPSESLKSDSNHLTSEGQTMKQVSEPTPVQNTADAHAPVHPQSNAIKLNSPPRKGIEGSNTTVIPCKLDQDCNSKTIECQQKGPIPQRSLPKHDQTSDDKIVMHSTSTPPETTNKLHNERLKEDQVLDLSLKKTPLLSRCTGNPETTEKENFSERVQDTQSVPRIAGDTQSNLRKPEVCDKPMTVAPSTAMDKNHHPTAEAAFQSSAAFMFKKYKILKLAPNGQVGAFQHNSQPGQPNNHPMQQVVRVLPQPILQPMPVSAFKNTSHDVSNSLPPLASDASPTTREARVSLPSDTSCKPDPTTCTQYFTDLHLSICSIISRSIAETSPQVLQEWLRQVATSEEPKERPKSPLRPKNGTRGPPVPRTSKVREIWLCFAGLPRLLNKVLSQMEAFILICKCPFPHVVRAGAIFIPIHLVKEKLFPGISVSLVDRVLQEHKVELRPTTLSEEKLLRDTELKSCSLRMLKLLALKQLPDIYPDLLDLHWHRCIHQQLGFDTQDKPEDTQRVEPQKHEMKANDAEVAVNKAPRQAMKEKRKKSELLRCSSSLEATESGRTDCLDDEDSRVSSPERPEQEEQLLSHPLPSHSCGDSMGGSMRRDTKSLILKLNRPQRLSDIKKRVFPAQKMCRPLQLKLSSLSRSNSSAKDYLKREQTSHAKPVRVSLKKAMARTARKTLSTSKVLHLRNSLVQIKFQQVLPAPRRPKAQRARNQCQPLQKVFRQKRRCVEMASKETPYPELVGKRIRHLYEENDKTEAWYQGVVLGIHQQHPNPLKTVYEVRYDSEPKWRYYLELLQDFENGWLELDN